MGSYYVVLEVVNANGTIWFKTAMAGKEESINKIIAERSAERLTHGDAVPDSQNNSAITIGILPKVLATVKRESFHQTANEPVDRNFHGAAIRLYQEIKISLDLAMCYFKACFLLHQKARFHRRKFKFFS